MDIEIRPCRDQDELAEFGRVVRYVFAMNDQQDIDAEMSAMQADWTMSAFAGGRCVTTYGAFPFTVRLNGAPVPMGGVTQVGTLPAYRRRGLLRRVMQAGLSQMRDRGQHYAILWASMGAIYQRFGYGLAAHQLWYTFDPRYTGFAFPVETRGGIELHTAEDAYPIIKPLYIEYATPRNLLIHRAAPLWRLNTLRPAKKGEPVYVAIHRDEDGAPRGYAVYQTHDRESSEPGPSQLLTVKDFVALDVNAYRSLWEYIRRHDLVGEVRIWNALPEDDPAPDLLLEPRMLNRKTHDAIWMRIVDVEKAIPERPYATRGELRFAIAGDDMCEWNNGTYLLETDGTTTDVRRTDREPQLTMPVNSLASLVSGMRSATHLWRAGRIEASDERSLTTADGIFRTQYAPHCPNEF